jgi:hypothetical protein
VAVGAVDSVELCATVTLTLTDIFTLSVLPPGPLVEVAAGGIERLTKIGVGTVEVADAIDIVGIRLALEGTRGIEGTAVVADTPDIIGVAAASADTVVLGTLDVGEVGFAGGAVVRRGPPGGAGGAGEFGGPGES